VDQVKLPFYASYKVVRELYGMHSNTESLLIQGRWRSVANVQEFEDEYAKARGIQHRGVPLVGHARLRNESCNRGFGKLSRG
jgi:hypothetical protein